MSARRDAEHYLTLFAHVAARPEAELDLGQAALLIAEPEYPDLDVAYYVALLDKVGDEARRRIAGGPGGAPSNPARRLGRLLYEEIGFEGNEREYYDPRNSFLNQVIDRKTGIPVTLAVVYMEVARRAGIDARGIGFPGHFLVQVPDPASGDKTIVDPFTGKVLGDAELRSLLQRATGEKKELSPALLEPIPRRQILMRMLNNLRAIYHQRRDGERLRRTLEQLAVLSPGDDGLRRDLAAVGGRVPPSAGRPPTGQKIVN